MSCMAVVVHDHRPLQPTMPGRSTSGFHPPGRHCLGGAKTPGDLHHGLDLPRPRTKGVGVRKVVRPRSRPPPSTYQNFCLVRPIHLQKCRERPHEKKKRGTTQDPPAIEGRKRVEGAIARRCSPFVPFCHPICVSSNRSSSAMICTISTSSLCRRLSSP